MNPHLLLVDGSNYAFRAFHGIRPFYSSKGEPTSAIFGFINMLRSMQEKLKPTHMAVMFDPRGGTFRHKEYTPYKANRSAMPEELSQQWPHIMAVTQHLGMHMLCVDNFEADDVIATLAVQAQQKYWRVSIASADKDLMQLVNTQVQMYDSFKEKFIDEDAVLAKWGVAPNRIRDLLALAGDSSDNIPGVPSIGPKTAATLLHEYGEMEQVLQQASNIKQKKRRETLLAHQEDARLSYYLVTLRYDVPLPCDLDALAVAQANQDEMITFCQKFELNRLAQQFQATDQKSEDSTQACQYHNIEDQAQLQQLSMDLNQQSIGLHVHRQDNNIQAFAFATDTDAWMVSLQHGLEAEASLKHIHSILAAAKDIFVFDAKLMHITLQNLPASKTIWDTMLLAYCLHPAKYAPSLKNIAHDHLGFSCINAETILGKGRKKQAFADVDAASLVPMMAETAWLQRQLGQKIKASLEEEQRLERYTEIEYPVMQVLSHIQHTGAKLDIAMLNQLSEGFIARITTLEKDIQDLAGCTFNVHSPAQLGDVLFNRLGLKGGKKTKTGAWSTGQEILENLAEEHLIAQKVIEVRQLSKLNSTYTSALPKLCDVQDHVHTSFNQAITSTGRLSSSEPNLQNIPIRSQDGRQIRKAFIADKGKLLLAADYSQIELRLMAHYSQDAALLESFSQGLDIHRATAASIHGIALDQVSGEQRRAAKAVNFGILYGMSAFGLAKQLKVPRAEAQHFIDAYFARYPAVQAFMDETLEQARAQGYVQTLHGHRVYVADINSKNKMLQKYAQRTAINAPLQGSAADIIKVAMIHLQQKLQNEPAKCILQVHDELVIEADEAHVEHIKNIVVQAMQNAIQLRVPLVVDVGIGRTWFDAHQL
ncbi:MAG: DNA polymerase I [Mariprofundaceae bacterium]|nr:DNA polymerase I [Mariprofundaceae bacterium]